MIRNSLFILIALLLAVNLSSCEKAKEIGLQLYSVRDDMRADPAQTIIKVGEIGYNVAEAAGYGDGKFYGMEPLEFKKLLNDNGMEFLSSHTGRPARFVELRRGDGLVGSVHRCSCGRRCKIHRATLHGSVWLRIAGRFAALLRLL